MALAKHPLTHVVVADQCMYGLLSPTPGGGELPAMKPTRFLTSSPEMAARLSTRCSKDHQHQQLVGGQAAAAAFYPLKLIKAMLLGMRDKADAKSKLLDRARGYVGCLNQNICSLVGCQWSILLEELH